MKYCCFASLGNYTFPSPWEIGNERRGKLPRPCIDKRLTIKTPIQNGVVTFEAKISVLNV